MRKLVVAAVLLAACAKPTPSGYIKPSVRISAPRMAMVEQPFGLSVLLYGDYPPGEIGLDVTAGNREIQVPFSRSYADVMVSRVYSYRMEFTHSFYFRMWYAQRDDLLTGGRLFRTMDAGCADQTCDWDEWVYINVRAREVEYQPGEGMKLGAEYARGQHMIRLSCYDCRTGEGHAPR